MSAFRGPRSARSGTARPGGRSGLGLALAALLLFPGAPAAHEVPADVTVRLLIRADGSALHILVRAPLEAMRDIPFAQIGDGYLDLAAAQPQLRDAARLWIGEYLTVYANGESLGHPRLVDARAALPSSRAFASYGDARAHFDGPRLPSDTRIVWEQAMLDAWFRVPIDAQAGARFALRSGLAHLGVVTTTHLRYEPPAVQAAADPGVRSFEFTGDPGRIALDPDWTQAAVRFVREGLALASTHLDALVLLLGLAIPLGAGGVTPAGRARGPDVLASIIAPVSIGAGFGLAAGGMGLLPTRLWFSPAAGAAVALLILLVALDNVIGMRERWRPWLSAAGGLFLAFSLWPLFEATRQYAGAHAAAGTVAFSIGVVASLAVLGALSFGVSRFVLRSLAPGRVGVVVLSVLIAHASWHWLGDRGSHLFEHPIPVPALDASLVADALGWSMLVIAAAAVAILLRGIRSATADSRPRQADSPAPGRDQPAGSVS